MSVTQNSQTHPTQQAYDAVNPLAASLPQLRWADHLANVVSQIASPPVLAVVMAGLCAAHSSEAGAWRWAAIHAGLTVAFPVVILVWLVARGTVSDLDVQHREQRVKPMLAALLGAAASLAILCLAPAPQLLLGIGLATYLQLLLIFIVTLRWKISVHTTAAASFTVLMCSLTGVAALPLVGLILLVAWARMRLKRHTLAQTIAGALLGSLTMTLALTLGR
jgi:membrane-associated phospholipid phosphatase